MRTFLLLLFLLWFPGAKGEMCRSWMFGIHENMMKGNMVARLHAGLGPLRCPGKTDPFAYRFCCGSCLQPYCCPWTELRLDQEVCRDSGELLGLSLKDLASIPTRKYVETSPPPTSPPAVLKTRAYIGYVWPVLLVILVAISIGGSCWLIRKWVGFAWLRRQVEDSSQLELVQVSPPSNADDAPSTSAAAEGLHVSNPAMDIEASSPNVEGLQESCEMFLCLDKPISGHSYHPFRGILKNKGVIILPSCLQVNLDGLTLEPAVAAEPSSE